MKRILSAVAIITLVLSLAPVAMADSSHGGDSSASASASSNAQVNGSGNSNNTNVVAPSIKNSNEQGQSQSTSVRNSNEQGQFQGQGQGQKQGQGQGQNNGQNISYKTDYAAAPPSMGVSALVAAPETCMGSIAGSLTGGNGIIGAGIGLGKTYESVNCNRRMNARYLMQKAQMTGDARYLVAVDALLAQDEDVAKAFAAAGIEIPGVTKKAEVTPTPTAVAPAQTSSVSDREAARRAFEARNLPQSN